MKKKMVWMIGLMLIAALAFVGCAGEKEGGGADTGTGASAEEAADGGTGASPKGEEADGATGAGADEGEADAATGASPKSEESAAEPAE